MYRDSAVIRWRRYGARYRMEAGKCGKCGKIAYPAKRLCECGGKEFGTVKLSGKGKLLSFTDVKGGPEKFASKAPYCVGIVELAEGPRLAGQIVDCDLSDLRIGLEVEAVFRKFYESGRKGAIHYGTKFAPKF